MADLNAKRPKLLTRCLAVMALLTVYCFTTFALTGVFSTGRWADQCSPGQRGAGPLAGRPALRQDCDREAGEREACDREAGDREARWVTVIAKDVIAPGLVAAGVCDSRGVPRPLRDAGSS